MIVPGTTIFSMIHCPTCCKPVMNMRGPMSLFYQYMCTDSECADFGAVVTVEKVVMQVLSVDRPWWKREEKGDEVAGEADTSSRDAAWGV